MGWRDLESFSFGDSPALADELSILVFDGVKTATCWAAVDGKLTEVGKRMAMLDGSGVARAVLETALVQIKYFCREPGLSFRTRSMSILTQLYYSITHRVVS